eukprot:5584-Eustigmatos_ZCMA.PRE.1
MLFTALNVLYVKQAACPASPFAATAALQLQRSSRLGLQPDSSCPPSSADQEAMHWERHVSQPYFLGCSPW